MLKGSIYFTTDPNLCMANLNTCKTITIADEPVNLNIPGKIGGSILLPPYKALASLIEDDYEKFRFEYEHYLLTDITVNKFIDIILQALIVGTNIIFYIEPDAPKFDGVLKEFFMGSFGIYIGDQNNNFIYNTQYNSVILSRLYMDDSIEKEYFLKLFPVNEPFDPMVVGKLAYEYGIKFRSQPEAENYFMTLVQAIKNGGLVRDVVTRLG